MKQRNIDLIMMIAVILAATGVFVGGIALVFIATDIHHYVQATESAWTAPWINTITRGPVQ